MIVRFFEALLIRKVTKGSILFSFSVVNNAAKKEMSKSDRTSLLWFLELIVAAKTSWKIESRASIFIILLKEVATYQQTKQWNKRFQTMIVMSIHFQIATMIVMSIHQSDRLIQSMIRKHKPNVNQVNLQHDDHLASLTQVYKKKSDVNITFVVHLGLNLLKRRQKRIIYLLSFSILKYMWVTIN